MSMPLAPQSKSPQRDPRLGRVPRTSSPGKGCPQLSIPPRGSSPAARQKPAAENNASVEEMEDGDDNAVEEQVSGFFKESNEVHAHDPRLFSLGCGCDLLNFYVRARRW